MLLVGLPWWLCWWRIHQQCRRPWFDSWVGKIPWRRDRLLLLLLLSRSCRVWLCATPEMEAHQAPPSLGLSRQEHWSGLPCPSPMHESEKWKRSPSVVPDSSRHHGLQPTRLLRPWGSPGKSTGVGCHRPLRRDRLPTSVLLGFPGGSDFKNLLAIRETRARFLGREDPLEEGMATDSSILAWRIPIDKESMGSQRVEHDCVTKHSTMLLVFPSQNWKLVPLHLNFKLHFSLTPRSLDSLFNSLPSPHPIAFLVLFV